MFSFLALALGCDGSRFDAPERPCDTGSCVLVVGTSGDYAPFSQWPEDEAFPDGFSVAVAEAYSRSRGLTVEWIRFRWPELTTDLLAGRFDVALSGVTVRPERSIAGRFSLPLTTSGAVVLVPASSPIRSASDLDHEGVTLAVNAGGHLERVARKLFPRAEIEAIDDNTGVLDRLVSRAVEGVVTDRIEAPHWQRRSPTRLRSIGPLTRDAKAAWFAIGHEADAIEFDRWLLEAEKTGELDRLRRRFGLPSDPTARALPALLSRLNERLSLMPAVANAKLVLGKPIEDPSRETKVLDAAKDDVESAATTLGLRAPDSKAVERLFRAQIEAAKWIQEERVRQYTSSANAVDESARERARTELDTAIRPALLYLGNRISMLIVVSANERPMPLSYEEVALALENQGLPEAHLRALHEAIADIIGLEERDAPWPPPEPATPDTAPSA